MLCAKELERLLEEKKMNRQALDTEVEDLTKKLETTQLECDRQLAAKEKVNRRSHDLPCNRFYDEAVPLFPK